MFDDLADAFAVQDEVNEILLKPQGARQQLSLFAQHTQQPSLLPHLSVLVLLSPGHVQRGRGLRPERLDQHQVLRQGADGPARQEESHAVGPDSQRDGEQRLYASQPEPARQLGLLQPGRTVDIQLRAEPDQNAREPGWNWLLTGVAADETHLLARTLGIPRHRGQRDPRDRGQATGG